MSVQLPAHHQAARPPVGRAVFVLPAAIVVTGGVWWWMTAGAPAADRTFVAWYGGVAAAVVCAAVTVAAYCVQAVRHLRGHAAALDAEVARLADDTLPAVIRRVREGASADTAIAEVPGAVDGAHRRLLDTVAQEIGRGERMRAATMAACANAAGRVQALATSMLADLREMEGRYDENVLGDLLKLDHSTAQAGRLADSIAVLTGARSGRRWTKPIVMESILRGAMGRISAYQRVRTHSTSTVAVAGYAAEGVMHALAELMDNAAAFSPPSEHVHVYVEEVHAGVVVTIEDSGLVMSPAALERAVRAVSAEPLDLTTLSGTRLGLAVVGCLARKHGLTVHFRPSARGGTGVVVMIPRQLITQPEPDVPVKPSPPDAPPAPVAATASPAATESKVESASSGLPQRRRGQTLAAAPRTAAPPVASPAPVRADAGARFSAFRAAGRGTRPSAPSEDSR
ncbi:sensor histidine kinase [Amycolatopsis mediterranei]|uniref:sensor histidine kinase n=1 Tax=Amycolatopsis mediterranei TaxID=33910 RepID=UPI000ADEEFCE|nr:ATP-binding protein [Amycolatopsis mediterranei]UZF68474.1 ATP-binding protein [Amycolatopsis mediterranei]